MPVELLTVDDVAKGLKVHPQTVRKLIDKGDLEAVLVSPSGSLRRRYRVHPDEYNRYVREVGVWDPNQ
jgi:excisionase family DNA binding protein